MDPSLLVSPTALDRLEEFSDEFSSAFALSPVTPWAEQLGYFKTSDALKTRWPIPIDAAGYKEFKGDIKFRSLYGRELSLKTRTWQDGVECFEADLADPGFIGWNDAPANMALAWQQLTNDIVAELLEANPRVGLYDDPDSDTLGTRTLFASDHPYNVLMPAIGTFDNDTTTTVAKIKSGEFFKDMSYYFSTMKGPNGKSMALSFAGGNVLVPAVRHELLREVLQTDTLIRAVSNAGVPDATASVVAAVTQDNTWKNTVGLVRADELTNTDYIYVLAAPKPGMHAWVGQKESAPKEIRHDYDSELYKRQLKLGVALIGRANAGACLPHRIVRVQITG